DEGGGADRAHGAGKGTRGQPCDQGRVAPPPRRGRSGQAPAGRATPRRPSATAGPAPIQPTTTEPLSAGLRTPRPLRRNPTQPLDTDNKEDSFWPSRGYEPSAVLTAHHEFYCGEAVAGKLFPHQQFTLPEAFLMCGHLALRYLVLPFTVSRTESLPCRRSWRPGWPRLGLSPGARGGWPAQATAWMRPRRTPRTGC